MKDRIEYAGRSLVFNIVFVVLNLIGLSFLVMAYHDAFVDSKSMFLLIALVLMITSIGGLIVFQGRLMMSGVARVLVGGLFIVSGLVKANDPLGFAYKLEEYFEDGALAFRIKEWFGMPGFSLEGLIEYSLMLSVVICIVEIVLGVLTIIGGKIKLVSYLMMGMMIFFTFLTWHTANCDPEVKFADHDTYEMTDPIAQMKIDASKESEDIKIISQTETEVVIEEMKTPQCVDDCGCFGDALKGSVGRSLTPKESLWKDITLVYLVIWIFIAQWIIQPNTRRDNRIFIPASILVIVFFSWVFGWYFPIWFGILAIALALWTLRVGGKTFGNYWGVMLAITILCAIMEFFVLRYGPLKDYRPYAIGSDMHEKMNDGIEGKYESIYIYKNTKNGEMKEMTENEYMSSKIWEDSDWEYSDRIQKTIIEAKNPSIMDFKPMITIEGMKDCEREFPMIKSVLDTSTTRVYKILDLGYNSTMDTPEEEYSPEAFPAEEYQILDTVEMLNPVLTDIVADQLILAQNEIVILVSKKMANANWSDMDRIKAIQKACNEKQVPFIMICNGSPDEIEAFRKDQNIEVPIFLMDEIELKIISRLNPALLILKKGVVEGKYGFRSIPNVDSFKELYLK